MQTKLIDCKMKEIYYTPLNIEEEAETIESRNYFWSAMNAFAMQNISLVQFRR